MLIVDTIQDAVITTVDSLTTANVYNWLANSHTKVKNEVVVIVQVMALEADILNADGTPYSYQSDVSIAVRSHIPDDKALTALKAVVSDLSSLDTALKSISITSWQVAHVGIDKCAYDMDDRTGAYEYNFNLRIVPK